MVFNRIREGAASAQQAGSNFVSNTTAAVSGAISTGQQAGSNFVSNATATVGGAISTGQQTGSNIVSGIGNAVGGAISTGQQTGSNIVSGIGNAVGGAISTGQQAGSNITSGINNAINPSQISSNINALANNAANSMLNRVGAVSPNQISNNNLSPGIPNPRNAALAAGLMAAGALGAGANTVHSAFHNPSGTVTRANPNDLNTQARHVVDRVVAEARQSGIRDNRIISSIRDGALRDFYQDRVSFALSDNSPEAADVRNQLESDPNHIQRALDLGVIDPSRNFIEIPIDIMDLDPTQNITDRTRREEIADRLMQLRDPNIIRQLRDSDRVRLFEDTFRLVTPSMRPKDVGKGIMAASLNVGLTEINNNFIKDDSRSERIGQR